MNLQLLLQLVNHPDTKIRLNAVYAVGMADETRARDTLQKRLQIETDPHVQKAIVHVSTHLDRLRSTGYDPIRAICAHFNVYSDVLAIADAREVQMAKRVSIIPQEAQLTDDEESGGGVFTGSSANIESGEYEEPEEPEEIDGMSGLSSVAQSVRRNARLIPALSPSADDIGIWLKRLAKEENPTTRTQILSHITSINNPDALLYIAHTQVTDPDPQVRAAAKHFGRLLYWRQLYWEMTQSGMIDEIRENLAERLHVHLPAKKARDMSVTAQESVEQILRKAEARRAKRKV